LIDGVEIALDVSIGEATNAPGQHPIDLLLRRADIAMYEAKRSQAGVVTWHEQLGVTGLRL
jgi:GGDEF domain-containing protein